MFLTIQSIACLAIPLLYSELKLHIYIPLFWYLMFFLFHQHSSMAGITCNLVNNTYIVSGILLFIDLAKSSAS